MDDKEELKRILREIACNLSDEEKQQAILVAEYLKFMHGGKDYEGKQTFLTEDYSRRN